MRKHHALHVRNIIFVILGILWILIFPFFILNSESITKIISYNTKNVLYKNRSQSRAKLTGEYKDDRIVIQAISLDAPIVWTNSLENIMEDLERGIVHDPRTALPGDAGNVMLTGHSSNFPFLQGSYKSVFANLSALKKGDHVEVYFQGTRYTYEVQDIFRTHAKDMSVLTQTKKPTLTLMTCWPVGTAWKRLIVRSELTTPAAE